MADLTLRSRLHCVVTNSACPGVQKEHLVLNEVVVDRGPSPYLSDLDLFIDGKHITTVRGDGLIISTPTGSTAYAIAAGASMVHPSVPAIMVTPICPHSLSFRPIVVPADVELKVQLSPDSKSSKTSRAWCSFDGQRRQELRRNDVLTVTCSISPASVCGDDQNGDWFNSLAECLHWNQRQKQRPLKLNGDEEGDGINGDGINHS